MNKVTPSIQQFQEDDLFSLNAITVFTLENVGTFDVVYSFGDGWATLKAGISKTFEAGANSVFTSTAMLLFRFKEPETVSNGDYRGLLITSGRLTEESRMNAVITGGK
ncbi:MAG: hypothetical protein HGA42_00605 [Nostocales cyanobacterium W4_Combined_metabat2_030]|nr:hypothetical protein [Nostocales cyanobacterium W4_Combined_metabat2_030]